MAFGMNFRGGLDQLPGALEAFASRLTTLWSRQHDNAGGHVFPPTRWTPVLTFGLTAAGITYTAQQGTAVKVGPLVTVDCRITLSAVGAAAGVAIIMGLPYVPEVTDSLVASGVCGFAANMSGLTGTMVAFVTSDGIVLTQGAATGTTVVTNAEFTATSDVCVSVTYRTAN